MIVIGDSSRRNIWVVKRVKERMRQGQDNVDISADTVHSSCELSLANLEDYDLAVVDNGAIAKRFSRSILGSGMPVLTFLDIADTGDEDEILHSVLRSTVEHGLLRDKIASTSRHIEETSRMLASCATP